MRMSLRRSENLIRLTPAVLFAAALLWLVAGLATATGGNSIASPDTFGDVGVFPSLALDASGNPVVSYFDHSNGGLKVLHCGNANCTAGNSVARPDTADYFGFGGTSLALDGSGNPVVSYYDDLNLDLKVLHCGDANCTSGNSFTSPDTAGDVGLFPSLALDASGNPVVSYADGTNGDLKVLHCNDPNCSGGDESITALDTIGNVKFQSSSLALDGSGNPVVSYYDGTNRDLKVLHCGDANCTSGNSITSPDTAGDVGRFPSLALDASDNPVVSYVAFANGDLKVLHCNDPNCSGGDESITAPDRLGEVEGYTSVALDGAGNPVVSYYDCGQLDVDLVTCTTGDLKVLHCKDPDCTGDGSVPTPDATPDVPTSNNTPTDTPAPPTPTPPSEPTKFTPSPTATTRPTRTPTQTNTPTSTTMPASPGDANGDGTVNAIDAALVLQLAAGLISSLPGPGAADVNLDGVTNAIDAALILQFAAGLLDSLPP